MWMLRRAHPCAGKGTNDLFACTDSDAPDKCLLWSEEISMTLYLGGIFQVKMIMKILTSFSHDAKRAFNNSLVVWCILT